MENMSISGFVGWMDGWLVLLDSSHWRWEQKHTITATDSQQTTSSMLEQLYLCVRSTANAVQVLPSQANSIRRLRRMQALPPSTTAAIFLSYWAHHIPYSHYVLHSPVSCHFFVPLPYWRQIFFIFSFFKNILSSSQWRFLRAEWWIFCLLDRFLIVSGDWAAAVFSKFINSTNFNLYVLSWLFLGVWKAYRKKTCSNF